jgi:hypothetical protein
VGYYQFISPRIQLSYPLVRLFSIQHLHFPSDRRVSVLLPRRQLIPVTDRLFREKDQSIATLALLPESDGQTLIQLGRGTYEKVSGWRVWGQLFWVLAVAIVMVSSPIRVLVWCVRKLLGKLGNAGPLSLRLMPFLSTLCFGAFFGFAYLGLAKPFALGVCGVASLGIMLSTIAFALTAAASLFLVWRNWRTPMGRFAWWRSALVAVAVASLAAYMGYWGLIGLRLWAY